MTLPPYPVIRLNAKANARAIRHGAPWVFDNELVTDRRTKSLAPGTLAVLHDENRTPLGLVGVNPKSRIMARMLDRDETAQIDAGWFKSRIARALEMRERIYDAPFYRLIHAEADGLPGVVVDRFGDTLVVQPNAAWAELLLAPLTEALSEVTGCTVILKNAAGRTRTLEGLDDVSSALLGSAPDAPILATMNGAQSAADVTGGQKTGLFYDQRPNHAFAASLSKDARVLDVFSHVGGFALAALAGGAASALSVDGSAAALELAETGAKASGLDSKFATRKGDAFAVLEELAQEGERFDVVICDPPAFAPGKKSLETGLRAYERLARMASVLVKDGGYLVLCSCSHAADLSRFRGACARGIGRAGRAPALLHTGFAGPDHPMLPQLAESGYLKALFFRL
jgi:23S rRNA (cytosine1962-C5)-methyltransferase